MRIGSEEEIFSSSSTLFLALRLFEENANRNRKCSRTVSCGHKKSNSFWRKIFLNFSSAQNKAFFVARVNSAKPKKKHAAEYLKE